MSLPIDRVEIIDKNKDKQNEESKITINGAEINGVKEYSIKRSVEGFTELTFTIYAELKIDADLLL